jgi:hypothetical protein
MSHDRHIRSCERRSHEVQTSIPVRRHEESTRSPPHDTRSRLLFRPVLRLLARHDDEPPKHCALR